MRLYEEIYTSAPELLEGGDGNLGVVARTRGFPAEVGNALLAARSYTLLDGLSLQSPGLHPPRIVIGACGPTNNYYSVSQTVFAGADHTGRTRPLTHQMVVERDELDRSGASYSSVLAAMLPLLTREWNQSPMWIDPPRTFTFSHGLPERFPSPAWSRLGVEIGAGDQLFSIADALVNFSKDRRPVLICLPIDQGAAAADLILDLLLLVPHSVQHTLTSVSHVVEDSDYVRDAALLFTYRSAPFWTHARHRQDAHKPILVDLARSEASDLRPLRPYARALRDRWKLRQTAHLVSATKQWDEWGFTNSDVELFPMASELNASIDHTLGPESLSKIAGQCDELKSVPHLARHIEQWCQHIVDLIDRENSQSRWEKLARIQLDDRWPASVRDHALRSICSDPEQSLSFLLSNPPGCALPGPEREALLRAVFARPQVVDQLLAAVIHDASPACLERAKAACERFPWNFEVVSTYLMRISEAAEVSRRTLRPILLQATAKNVKYISQIKDLCRSAAERAEQDAGYGRDVCQLVLRPHLEHAKGKADFDSLAEQLLTLAQRSGFLGQELEWLVHSDQQSRLSPQLLQKWTNAANGKSGLAISNQSLPDSESISSASPVASWGNDRRVLAHRRRHAPNRIPGLRPRLARMVHWACWSFAILTIALAVVDVTIVGGRDLWAVSEGVPGFGFAVVFIWLVFQLPGLALPSEPTVISSRAFIFWGRTNAIASVVLLLLMIVSTALLVLQIKNTLSGNRSAGLESDRSTAVELKVRL